MQMYNIGSAITIIVIGIAVIALFIVLAINANMAAVAKGYDGSLYGILCFLTGPLGLILVAALPDLTLQAKEQLLLQEQIKTNHLLTAIANGNPVYEFLATAHAPKYSNASAVSAVPADEEVLSAKSDIPITDDKESQSWVCQYCGHTNEPNHLFCLNCGEPRQPEEQK